MGGFRYTMFAILLLASLTHGAKRKVACKNCLKNKGSHHNGNRLIASPINLLNPDRYEFFTLDDKGKVVKRIMTFNEIQSIVAGSDISELKLFTNGNNNERIVSSVVSNVRNVLNNELNLMNGHEGVDFPTELSISDVISVQREPITSSTAGSSDQMNEGPSERPATEIPTTKQTEHLSERPVESILQQSELITLLKSTVKHEALNTTDRTTEITTEPTTTSSSTERTTRSTTAQPTTRTTEKATTVRTTVRTTQRPTEGSPPKTTIVISSFRPALKTTEQSTEHSSTRPTTEKPQTTRTTTQQTERPTEKFATQYVKSTVATTNIRPTEIEVVKLTEQPTLLPVESSTQPTNEKSTENYSEHLVTESSEKSVEESIYPIEASVEISSEESTEFTITKAPQISSQFSTKIENESDSDYSTDSSSASITTASLISGFLASTSLHPYKKPVSAEGPSMSQTTESDDTAGTLKDLISTSTNFEDDSSETFKTPTESDTLLTDAIAQYITNIQREPVVTTVFGEVSDDNVESSTATVHPEETTLGMTASYEALPTTTVLEAENDLHLEDSTEASNEESENIHSSTWELPEDEVTTTENLKSKPSQMDIVPSDAQQALHKIIESLQFPDEGADSKETDMKLAQSTMIPEMDDGPLTYDTDAQNSINAIIQSLGQGSLFSDENSIMSITTDETTKFTTVTETTPNTTPSTTTTTTTTTTASTTTSTEKTTTSTQRPSSTAYSTFSVPVHKTASATESSETDLSSNINYNTNIMDTIEKFLSKFAGLPNPESYSVNMTKMDVLSDFPSEINMTDYVDRTATVASVLKFPHTKPVQLDLPLTNRDSVPEEPELFDDTPVEPMLNETVASFMKLGEMLTMGSIINTSPEPTQVELKTVVDEEETELLRFLSICGNLGTNMYRDLTDISLHSRSLVYSPFATITTLSMLFLGTRGTTAESINGVIGLDEMTSFNPHLFFKSIADDLQPRYRRKAVPTFEGSSFSRTLLSDRTQGGLQRFFKARVQEIYSAVAEPIDFHQKDEILRHMSGDFPREYVNTLKQLRAPLISISRNRYRLECNSATLYGVMNFQRISAEAISPVALPSVTFRSGFSTGFSKSLNATIVSLPGSTSNVSVFFLKPAEISGHSDNRLEALEAHIHTQSISNVLKLFPDETVRTAYAEVQLPHFTQTSMYNMSRSIRQLGLENLFQSDTANFNGLQDSTISNMYLSETIQTDSFALCNKGELATKSSVAFHSFSTNLPKHASIVAIGNSTAKRIVRNNRRKNRSVPEVARAYDSMLVFDTPFLYLVRHNPTGLLLYVGRFLG